MHREVRRRAVTRNADLQRFWGVRFDSTGEVRGGLGEDLKQLKSIIKNGQISLRTIILKQMDVSKIQFLNVVWNSKVHRLGPIKIFERIVILEERLLEVGEKRRDYEAVAHIYWGSDTTMSGIVDMPRLETSISARWRCAASKSPHHLRLGKDVSQRFGSEYARLFCIGGGGDTTYSPPYHLPKPQHLRRKLYPGRPLDTRHHLPLHLSGNTSNLSGRTIHRLPR